MTKDCLPVLSRIRNAEIGNKDFKLDTLEEAYTTEHWLVRIYKVKDLDNRGNWESRGDDFENSREILY